TQRGDEIAVHDDRRPSRAMAIQEHLRPDGDTEMERDALALLGSAIAAGRARGASRLATGLFHGPLAGLPGGGVRDNLGDPFG
ncbi:hypothetical protein Q6254_27800, partial [Klebsiella pneumoniae]|nr:hypothetical protein [Klebsiella pneumoniae]